MQAPTQAPRQTEGDSSLAIRDSHCEDADRKTPVPENRKKARQSFETARRPIHHPTRVPHAAYAAPAQSASPPGVAGPTARRIADGGTLDA